MPLFLATGVETAKISQKSGHVYLFFNDCRSYINLAEHDRMKLIVVLYSMYLLLDLSINEFNDILYKKMTIAENIALKDVGR